jgi:hypothetical protein
VSEAMHQVQMNYEVKIDQTNRFLYKPQSSRDTTEEATYTQHLQLLKIIQEVQKAREKPIDQLISTRVKNLVYNHPFLPLTINSKI